MLATTAAEPASDHPRYIGALHAFGGSRRYERTLTIMLETEQMELKVIT